MGTYAKRLSAMQNNFETAQSDYKDAFTSGVPAGVYAFKLSRFEMGETSNNTLAMFREQVITEGEHKGETVFDMLAIESDFGMKKCLTFYDQMGYEIEGLKATDIEEIAEAIAADEPSYKGRLRYSKGGFPNVSIMEVYENEDDSGESPADEAPVDEAPAEEEATQEESVNDVDEVLDRVKEFCTIRGIPVQDDDDMDAITEVFKDYTFKKSELDIDEIQLFEDAGLTDLFEDEEVKDAPPAKKKDAAKKKDIQEKTTSSRVRKKK